jgi:hypothetical protein
VERRREVDDMLFLLRRNVETGDGSISFSPGFGLKILYYRYYHPTHCAWVGSCLLEVSSRITCSDL